MGLFVALLTFLVIVDAVVGLPPVMSFHQKVGVLNERTNANQPLGTITCTDPDNDLTRVFVRSVSPSGCAKCFEVLDCLPDECLQYRAGVGTLSYASAQTYIITLECDDNKGGSTTGIFQVDIVPNLPPYFTSADKHDLVSLSGKAGPGTKIYTATAHDDDALDTLTYSMTVEPSTSANNYRIDPQTGDIYTTVDMRTECRNDVTFEVSVSDGQSTTGPLIISAPITDPNVAPVGVNLDTIAMIPEDTAAGGVAYPMEFVDGNGDKVTYTYTATNPAATAQFNIDGKKPQITVGAALDYEKAQLRQTDLVVTATDGFCSSPPYSLKLRVTDVNEPPVISPLISSVQTCEGQGEFDPGYVLTDQDVPDTVRWSLVSVSPSTPSRFGINPDTGAIIKLVNYDVDVDRPSRTAPMPANVKFVVMATDQGSLTATSTVSATFLDCNDNAPIIDQPAYEYFATECTSGGAKLGTITAKDKDSARLQNNVIYFEGSGGSVQVGSGGEIIVAQALPAGSVITFNVYAWDRGQNDPGPLRSVNPTPVSVTFTPCPTTPPPTQAPPPTTTTTTTTTPSTTLTTTIATTTGSYTTTDDDPNLPWIIIAALLAAFLLGLLTYMLWRYGRLCMDVCRRMNCDKSCRVRPKRAPKVEERPERITRREPMQRERPPSSAPSEEPKEKEPNGPGFLFSFWKEHYKEKALDKDVQHNSKPEPGDMSYVYPHTYDPADPPAGSEPTLAQASTADISKKKCSIQ